MLKSGKTHMTRSGVLTILSATVQTFNIYVKISKGAAKRCPYCETNQSNHQIAENETHFGGRPNLLFVHRIVTQKQQTDRF